jgi:hypothetical protein
VNRKLYIANAILWAGAIGASAILGAPTFLTLVVLPSLASCALVVSCPQSTNPSCQS